MYPISMIDSYCREKGGYPVEEERDVANLVLFLCTRLGDRLSGLAIGANGNVIAL
jgi:hypothetical protein